MLVSTNLVTFTEKILIEKLNFLSRVETLKVQVNWYTLLHKMPKKCYVQNL